MVFVYLKLLLKADEYPWIAALLRDEDMESGYINSKCGAVMVCT